MEYNDELEEIKYLSLGHIEEMIIDIEEDMPRDKRTLEYKKVDI